MRIDLDALRGTAVELRTAAARLGELITALQGIRHSVGACWGADEAGRRFYGQYGPLSDQTMTGLRRLADELRSLARTVDAGGNAMRAGDTANAAAVRRSGA